MYFILLVSSRPIVIYRVAQTVSHYQIIKKILLNRMKDCQ